MPGSSATATGVAHAPLATTWAVATPLTPVGFYPKFGPLPAVEEVRGQTGPWDAVGQTRQLMLSDGGSVIETIVAVQERERFVYELSEFQKLFGHLVSGARAEWDFTEVDGGTRITWTYTFHPYRRGALAVAAIVKLFWAPYMRRVLPGIIAEVERAGR